MAREGTGKAGNLFEGVNDRDIRVVQRRQRASFPLEARSSFFTF